MADDQQSKQPTESPEEALARFKRDLGTELDKFFDEDAIKARKSQGHKPAERRAKEQLPQLEITNFGVVATCRLPAGWVENVAPAADTQSVRFREFHPADHPAAKICFFFRGHRVTESAAGDFQKLFSKADHYLTPSEFKSLAEILRDLADEAAFKLLQAATRDLSGRKVLTVEGRFIRSEHDTYSVYVDVDGSGSIVQEVHYQAPKADYPRYLKEVKLSVDSIQWRQSE